MNRGTIFLLSIVLSLPSMAFVFPESPMRPSGAINSQQLKCANFNGTWKGKCPGEKEQTYTIEQDCDSFSVRENPNSFIWIGGENVLTFSAPQSDTAYGAFNTLTYTVSWNCERTELNLELNVENKELKQSNPLTSHFRFKESYKLADEKLIITAVGPLTTKPRVCVYSKI